MVHQADMLNPEEDGFTVRYGFLPSNNIANAIIPGAGPSINAPRDLIVREKIATNYIEMKNKQNGFYTRLEEDILENGFLNPVLVSAGYCNPCYRSWLPDEMVVGLFDHNVLCCDRLGGSRLWVAQKNDLDIPCIISDFVGMFADKEDFETLNSIPAIVMKFRTHARAKITPEGVHVWGLPHTHLDED